MNINASLNISALGIHRNIERFNAGAAEMARPDNAGRVEPLVEMTIAERGAQANMNAFKAAARLSRAAVDMVG